MPELPEVETTKNALKPLLINKYITKVFINTQKLRIPFKTKKLKKLEKKKVISIKRRAKYILIYFSNFYILVIHLGMSGRIVYRKSKNSFNKHEHFALRIEKGHDIILNDPRKFGLVDIVEKKRFKKFKLFKNLGIEPVNKEFTITYLKKIIKKKIPIKNLLLNQKFMAGMGNIYACESLFISGISPLRLSYKIKNIEIKKLHSSIIFVLKKAIKCRGSTLGKTKNNYQSPLGELGTFQNNFFVYNREGLNCLKCKNIIQRVKIAGRSSFFCEKCQI